MNSDDRCAKGSYVTLRVMSAGYSRIGDDFMPLAILVEPANVRNVKENENTSHKISAGMTFEEELANLRFFTTWLVFEFTPHTFDSTTRILHTQGVSRRLHSYLHTLFC